MYVCGNRSKFRTDKLSLKANPICENWFVKYGHTQTFTITKLYTYAKLNCCKWNCFLHLNCILMLN